MFATCMVTDEETCARLKSVLWEGPAMEGQLFLGNIRGGGLVRALGGSLFFDGTYEVVCVLGEEL